MDQETDLTFIPRAVRDKLDRVGLKLHLKDWQALPLTERLQLLDHRCESPDDEAEYGRLVERLVLRLTGQRPARLLEKGR